MSEQGSLLQIVLRFDVCGTSVINVFGSTNSHGKFKTTKKKTCFGPSHLAKITLQFPALKLRVKAALFNDLSLSWGVWELLFNCQTRRDTGNHFLRRTSGYHLLSVLYATMQCTKQSVDRNVVISWLLSKLIYHSLPSDMNTFLYKKRNTLHIKVWRKSIIFFQNEVDFSELSHCE